MDRSATTASLWKFGAVAFNEATRELSVAGQLVQIEPKPLDVLRLLLLHAGEVVTYDEFLEAIWPGRIVNEVAVANTVSRLRRALNDDSQQLIKTVPKAGYRLIAHVERSPIATEESPRIALKEGDHVPLRENWRLTERVGAGATGEVWKAVHDKTKELRIFKFCLDNAQLAPLKREVTLHRVVKETLGTREDIVQVIDWNFSVAPYFVETAFGGINLKAWVAGAPNDTPIKTRMAMAAAAATVVGDLHSVGVLHKDIKPENILVFEKDGAPHIRLTDFGAGGLVSPTRLADLGITQLGFTTNLADQDLAGSIMYLAPEVISGHTPSVQSDVYALGVLLYQLASGRFWQPIAPGWEADVQDEVLRGDIAAATQGDPRRRTQSASLLAEAISSIDDRRAAFALRKAEERSAIDAKNLLEKNRTRRPWLYAMGMTLGVGLAITSGLLYKVRITNKALQTQEGRLMAVNSFLTNDVFEGTDPGAPGGSIKTTVPELLDRAAKRLQIRLSIDPATKASLYTALGQAYTGMTRYKDAEKYQQLALDMIPAGSSDKTQRLEAIYALASTQCQYSDMTICGKTIKEGDDIAGPLLSGVNLISYQSAVVHGSMENKAMNPELAVMWYRRADGIREAIMPDNINAKVATRYGMAWGLVRTSHADEAVKALQSLTGKDYSPDSIGLRSWTVIQFEYALALSELHRYREAEQILKGATGIASETLGDQNYLTALVWDHLGTTYALDGNWEDAVNALTRATTISIATLGAKAPPSLAIDGEKEAAIYMQGGKADVIRRLEEDHEGLASLLGPTNAPTQEIAYYLAWAQIDSGQIEAARSNFSTLDRSNLDVADPGGDWVDRLKGLQGILDAKEGDKESGALLIQQAIAGMKAISPPDSNLAHLLQESGAAQISGVTGLPVALNHPG